MQIKGLKQALGPDLRHPGLARSRFFGQPKSMKTLHQIGAIFVLMTVSLSTLAAEEMVQNDDACLRLNAKAWAQKLTQLRAVWGVVGVQCQNVPGSGVSASELEAFSTRNNSLIKSSQRILGNALRNAEYKNSLDAFEHERTVLNENEYAKLDQSGGPTKYCTRERLSDFKSAMMSSPGDLKSRLAREICPNGVPARLLAPKPLAPTTAAAPKPPVARTAQTQPPPRPPAPGAPAMAPAASVPPPPPPPPPPQAGTPSRADTGAAAKPGPVPVPVPPAPPSPPSGPHAAPTAPTPPPPPPPPPPAPPAPRPDQKFGFSRQTPPGTCNPKASTSAEQIDLARRYLRLDAFIFTFANNCKVSNQPVTNRYEAFRSSTIRAAQPWIESFKQQVSAANIDRAKNNFRELEKANYTKNRDAYCKRIEEFFGYIGLKTDTTAVAVCKVNADAP